ARPIMELKTINPHITCRLCGGYFVDATTVSECLHTFCKSCLVKHLEKKRTCPTCHHLIHQSHPLQYISFDRTMQDIVYKLVPNLQQGELNPAYQWNAPSTQSPPPIPFPEEARRERAFYRSRNMPCPKDANPEEENSSEEAHAELDYHRLDEQVNVCLECHQSNRFQSLQRHFIRCSSQTTVTHLKKLLAKRLLNGIDKYREIELLCKEELLGKDHTLKFLFVTRWRFNDPPLRLQFRQRYEL
ncbi:hypothetical protein KR018_003496, partial [Drosophila ironensis]